MAATKWVTFKVDPADHDVFKAESKRKTAELDRYVGLAELAREALAREAARLRKEQSKP